MGLARVPDLDGLALLLQVADLGSFGRAAIAHGISQPAVSARMRSMEALVGFPLVERSARGSTLTAEGALVAGWARDVLAAAAVLGTGVGSLRGDRETHLRVAASMTIAEHLLPGWLVRLAVDRPDTVTSLQAMNSSQVEHTVLTGAADLGFVEGPSVASGLDAQLVARDQLVVIVPPGHRWSRRGATTTPFELATTRLVQREPASGTRAAAESAMARHGTPVTPLLELSTSGAVIAAVAAGAGPAILSSLAVRADLATGRVVAVDVPGVRFGRRLRAVWPRGQRPGGPARDLLAIARLAER